MIAFRAFCVSFGSSMLALESIAEPTLTTLNQTVPADADTKKLIISAVTSILSTLLLKFYEDFKKRKRTKRSDSSDSK